jgi:hypothetical protein
MFSKPKRIKKIFIKALLILGGLVIVGLGYIHFNSLDSLIKNKDVYYDVKKDGEKFTFMQGYAYRRDGIPVQVSLSGTHYEIGLQYGVLLKDEIRQMSNGLYKVIGYYSEEIHVPKDLVYIYFKYKIDLLSKNIPERFKQEIKGISDGSGVNINAIYAISLFDDLLHSMGCSSVLALTDDGTILHGRNEDLYFGMELGMKQVIVKYNPTGYNSFVSISFPGFIGVSTGYNDKGLGYSHHSRCANTINYKGYPQNCISRMALEECSSLNEIISFYKDKPVVIGDAHTWSDRNSLTGCIIETAPNEKDPVKVIEMSDKILWHINKYVNSDYKKNVENKYTGDVSFNNARQEIFSHSLSDKKSLTIDDVISLLREEKGPNGENYNMSDITRGICNMDTQQMVIFDPTGDGIYLARNYYLASKSTVYFIPSNFELTPYVYKKSEINDPIIEDIAIIKESVLSQSQKIEKLKELAVKYPDQGCIYYMISQALFTLGDINGWADYTDKAYIVCSSYDLPEITLEKAKVEFYKKDMKEMAQTLSNINYNALESFKAKAEFLYIYKMYFESVNDKITSQEYLVKFKELASDSKAQNDVIKGLGFLRN